MMMRVFLDDRRPKPAGYTLASAAEQAIRLLKTKKIGVLSLDYNLGTGRKTGLAVVNYMVHHRIYPRKIVIHSADASGRRKMLNVLRKNKPESVRVVVRSRKRV
jgi:hypothetical protein